MTPCDYCGLPLPPRGRRRGVKPRMHAACVAKAKRVRGLVREVLGRVLEACQLNGRTAVSRENGPRRPLAARNSNERPPGRGPADFQPFVEGRAVSGDSGASKKLLTLGARPA